MVSVRAISAPRHANSPHSPAAAGGTWSPSIQLPPRSRSARVTARWRAPRNAMRARVYFRKKRRVTSAPSRVRRAKRESRTAPIHGQVARAQKCHAGACVFSEEAAGDLGAVPGPEGKEGIAHSADVEAGGGADHDQRAVGRDRQIVDAAAQGHLVAAGTLRQVPEDSDRRFAVHPCGAWVRNFT